MAEQRPVANESTSSSKFTRSQKQCLACILSVCFASYATMSLIGPFYPDKARKLGLSEQRSGLTFSIYAIATVFFSPFMRWLVPMMKTKNSLLLSIFCNGLANVIFGMTEFIDDRERFFWTCITQRIVEAFGTIAHVCSSFALIIKRFPDDISYVFGLTESACGVGLASGPALGGLIYSVGGYGLPFYLYGSFVLVCLPISWYFIDEIKDDDPIDKQTSIKASEDCETSLEKKSLITFTSLMFKYEVFINTLVLVLVASANAFFYPTLQKYLESLNVLDLKIVAFEFFLGSSVYVASTLIIGKLLGDIKYQFTVMLAGVAFMILSLLMVGPSEILYFLRPGLLNTSIGMILVGIGAALSFIPTFECYYRCCIKYGLEDNITTYGTVAALWSTMFGFGEAIGPLSGGFLATYFNFQDSSSIMACSLILLLPFLIAMVIKEVRSLNAKKREKQHIVVELTSSLDAHNSYSE